MLAVLICIFVALGLFVLASFNFHLSPEWRELSDEEKSSRFLQGAVGWIIIGAVLGLFYNQTIGRFH